MRDSTAFHSRIGLAFRAWTVRVRDRKARPRSAALVFLVCGAVFAAACSSGPAENAVASTAASASPVNEYIIGPGDGLRIFVLRNPELNSDVIVRPDGKISSPLVSDMVAVGKTPSQLGADLAKVLVEYVRSPTVSVIVSNAQSTLNQVKVVGQAVNPRALPFRSGMTVLDLVIEVGGLSPFAAGNRAKIIRIEDGKTRELKVRLGDLLNDGEISQNVELRPGDVLFIPQTRF